MSYRFKFVTFIINISLLYCNIVNVNIKTNVTNKIKDLTFFTVVTIMVTTGGGFVRGNTQFPVATHILAVVGMSEHYNNHMPTSAEIADSVNTNPVVIRRIITLLKKSGFVTVRAGVGGVGLLKSPKDISLLDIYKGIQTNENSSLFDYHVNTKATCPIGATINSVLSSKLDVAQKKLEDELALYSLYGVMEEIAERNGSKFNSD